MPAIRELFSKLTHSNVNGFHIWTRRFNTSLFNATPKKTIEEKLGIPSRPKRPPSGFMIYASERRPILIQQNPDKKLTELVKIITQEWRNLDKSKKDEFQERFKKKWMKYLEETKKYDESLSPGEKERIKIEKEEAKILQAKKILKKKRSELGCPKKPGSSYMYFMQSKLSERHNESFMDFQQKLKVQWKDLPESEKKKYEEMYKKDMEEYREKMAEWNKQMLAMGNRDVVRSL
ncbi:transcription factor A, mitochondrial [Halyomorpha halys]|uniref:transcription factor A, mitochondrial n=1 Tax=Halyomorpha halys TaxID=286706 RepID=UPI0006D51196|nr:transcription factor A, mitochondrial [Halyomorpha halys]